jgi:hypothetical protein
MRVLLDHCINWRLRRSLPAHAVTTAEEMGWDELKNGKLLAAVGAGPFDLLLTVDQNIKAQQNLATLPVTVVVLIGTSSRLPDLLPLLPTFERVVQALLPGSLVEIRAGGITVVSGGRAR